MPPWCWWLHLWSWSLRSLLSASVGSAFPFNWHSTEVDWGYHQLFKVSTRFFVPEEILDSTLNWKLSLSLSFSFFSLENLSSLIVSKFVIFYIEQLRAEAIGRKFIFHFMYWIFYHRIFRLFDTFTWYWIPTNCVRPQFRVSMASVWQKTSRQQDLGVFLLWCKKVQSQIKSNKGTPNVTITYDIIFFNELRVADSVLRDIPLQILVYGCDCILKDTRLLTVYIRHTFIQVHTSWMYIITFHTLLWNPSSYPSIPRKP